MNNNNDRLNKDNSTNPEFPTADNDATRVIQRVDEPATANDAWREDPSSYEEPATRVLNAAQTAPQADFDAQYRQHTQPYPPGAYAGETISTSGGTQRNYDPTGAYAAPHPGSGNAPTPSAPSGKVALIVFGVLVLIALLVVGTYFLLGKKDDDGAGKASTTPATAPRNPAPSSSSPTSPSAEEPTLQAPSPVVPEIPRGENPAPSLPDLGGLTLPPAPEVPMDVPDLPQPPGGIQVPDIPDPQDIPDLPDLSTLQPPLPSELPQLP